MGESQRESLGVKIDDEDLDEALELLQLQAAARQPQHMTLSGLRNAAAINCKFNKHSPGQLRLPTG